MQGREKRNLAKPKDFIVKAYIEPILERLSQKAQEEVIESFCWPRCGKAPSEGFCLAGRIVREGFFQGLMHRTRSLN